MEKKKKSHLGHEQRYNANEALARIVTYDKNWVLTKFAEADRIVINASVSDCPSPV